MDIKLAYLSALAEPEYSRVEFWENCQKESGFSPKVFWLKLNDVWQQYNDRIWEKINEANAMGSTISNYSFPLLPETNFILKGHIGLVEQRLLFDPLMEFGQKHNLIIYNYEYDFSGVQLMWNASPKKNFDLLQNLKIQAFQNELSKKNAENIGKFLDFHFRFIKRNGGNVNEWLSCTKKIRPVNFTTTQTDAFLSWFEEKETGVKSNFGHFQTFPELFKAAAEQNLFGELKNEAVFNTEETLRNLQFSTWLSEFKGYEFGNNEHFKEFLTVDFFKEFWKYQKAVEHKGIADFEAGQKEKAAMWTDGIKTSKDVKTKTLNHHLEALYLFYNKVSVSIEVHGRSVYNKFGQWKFDHNRLMPGPIVSLKTKISHLKSVKTRLIEEGNRKAASQCQQDLDTLITNSSKN